jgi:ferredoxin
LGLGDFDLNQIEIDGRLTQIPDFKLPHWDGSDITRNKAVQTMLHNKTLLRPKVDPDTCTACGTCISQCPVEALSMVEDLPEVDKELCITCFCCQEVCPEKAISLQ